MVDKRKIVEPLDDDEDKDNDNEGAEEDTDHAEARKRLIVIVGSALLFVIGGISAAYFTGILDPLLRDVSIGDQEIDMSVASFSAPKPGYQEIPELVVNLNSPGHKRSFLKVRVTLELEDMGDLSKVEAVMPRIIDKLQVYLRELRTDDLEGARGIRRLRTELLARVEAEVKPVVIKDVLFKQIMVQ